MPPAKGARAMRHLSTHLLLMLAAGAAWGQVPSEPPSDPSAVKQALQEALTLQAPVPETLPRLPESLSEPPRAVAPRPRPSKDSDARLTRAVLDRAGKMAPRVPANPHAERTRPEAAASHASSDSQAAAGQVQAGKARGQRPPREGTPGATPQPGRRNSLLLPVSPVTPGSPPSPSGPVGP